MVYIHQFYFSHMDSDDFYLKHDTIDSVKLERKKNEYYFYSKNKDIEVGMHILKKKKDK